MKQTLFLFSFILLITKVISGPTFENCLGSKVISLTFDDGPDVATEQIVSILDKYNIKGTFFVNGLKVIKNNKYDLIKSMFAKGHIIGTHTFSHPALTGLNTFNQRREFFDNEFIVFRNLFNIRPYLVRCPYFDYNDAVMKLIDEFGYIIINASFESTDWINPNDPNTILNACKAQVDTGNNLLVLLHEHIMSNAIMLEEFILYAYSKNYTFVDTATCIGDSKTYNIENTYGPFLNNGVPGYT
jgi:peptidoglycan/xylan/chitin deacetylase (PgdA/CDA1 family)